MMIDAYIENHYQGRESISLPFLFAFFVDPAFPLYAAIVIRGPSFPGNYGFSVSPFLSSSLLFPSLVSLAILYSLHYLI
jgi:hypothetical protein